jgi:hypothetical protein
VGGQEPWKPWANDAESFERAVIADLEQRLSGSMTVDLMREDPVRREFRAIRLDGSYPNTAIVVSYLDINTGNVEEMRFPVWEEGYRAGNVILDPESIAEDIWTVLIEPF